MENKYLKETAMSLSPDTVDDPTTSGDNTGGDGGSQGGDGK
ncbi:hypothetical protein [Tenacibaculum singaporense]|nr:hypothetical protein [Tenacibaculum singaporense]